MPNIVYKFQFDPSAGMCTDQQLFDTEEIAELEWSHQKVTNTLQEAIYQGVPIFSLPLTFDQEGDLFRMRGESLIGSLNRDYFLEAGLQENVQELTLIWADLRGGKGGQLGVQLPPHCRALPPQLPS
ncbi:hypothetical protein NQZ68_022441 [Dissostichus eleginoides]|nr:hypothetical protein NQZ68_022441 [Dissostichus eleginoides]